MESGKALYKTALIQYSVKVFEEEYFKEGQSQKFLIYS